LALNARILSNNPHAFDELLKEFALVQILAWTGTGEPPIKQVTIDYISAEFKSSGYMHRLGFDCCIDQIPI